MTREVITGRRLLYVDDEHKALKYFPICLGDDVAVVVCSSARDALAILEVEHDQFDAIVSDDRMPIMSGGDLLDIVAERWPQISRIITTAYADIARLRSLIAARSVHRVIMKPWERSELRETIGMTIQSCRGNLSETSPAAPNTTGCEGTEIDPLKSRAPNRLHADLLPSAIGQLAVEFEATRQLEIPKIELTTCTIKECVDEAIAHLNLKGQHLANISIIGPGPIYVHSNPSCLGGAIAEFIGSSILAARDVEAAPRILIETLEERERARLVISDNGDWMSERLSSLLFDERYVEDDVRPGVGLAVAAWVVISCGAQVDVIVGRNMQTSIVFTFPRARN